MGGGERHGDPLLDPRDPFGGRARRVVVRPLRGGTTRRQSLRVGGKQYRLPRGTAAPEVADQGRSCEQSHPAFILSVRLLLVGCSGILGIC